MRNLLMLLVAVLGTSAMVHAFPAKTKIESAKEVKGPGKPAKTDKKAKAEKKETAKTETTKKEAPKTETAKAKK
jgi:hypothetical protein